MDKLATKDLMANCRWAPFVGAAGSTLSEFLDDRVAQPCLMHQDREIYHWMNKLS